MFALHKCSLLSWRQNTDSSEGDQPRDDSGEEKELKVLEREESLRDVFRNAYRRNSMCVLFEIKKSRKDDQKFHPTEWVFIGIM